MDITGYGIILLAVSIGNGGGRGYEDLWSGKWK